MLKFENLRRYPVPYLLYAAIGAMIFLYFADKTASNSNIDYLKKEIVRLQIEKDKKEGQIYILDSLLGDCQGKNKMTETLETLQLMKRRHR